jgi:hypothetical protein
VPKKRIFTKRGSNPTDPRFSPVGPDATSAYIKGILDLGNYPTFDEDTYATYADQDFLATTYGTWQDDDIAELLSRNPDCKIGSYFNVYAVQDWMKDASPGTHARDWWDGLYPYLHVVEGGDPAVEADRCSIEGTNWVWDFTQKAAREVALGLLKAYADDKGLKWFMMDLMSGTLGPFGGAQNYNDIPWAQDQTTLRATYQAYLKEARSLMPDILWIPNGDSAMHDPTVAQYTDGAFVEWFPRFFFDSANMAIAEANALDPDYYRSLYYLTSAKYYKGRGYVMLEERSYHGPTPIEEITPLFPKCVHIVRVT